MATLQDVVTLCSAATALAAVPAAWGDVLFWRTGLSSPVIVEMWSDGAAGLTATRLIGAVQKVAPAIADDDVNAVDTTANTLTVTAHAYCTGDGPVRISSSGALPGGLAADTNYWVMVIDANTIMLFASLAALIAAGGVSSTGAIDLTSAGSGTHTISDVVGGVDQTMRLHWQDLATVGLAGDGAVTMTAQRGLTYRLANHNRKVLAYALAGTVGSGNVTAHAYLENPRS